MSDNRKKQALEKQRAQSKEIVGYLIDDFCEVMNARGIKMDKEHLLSQAFDLIEDGKEESLAELLEMAGIEQAIESS